MTTWNIESMTGYKPITTFWEDFSIADMFGVKAIKDTYKRAFEEWKGNTEYVTELTMVLNWKIWEYSETNLKLAQTYNALWEKVDNWCCTHLKGEDLTYFFDTTN